MGVTIEGDSQPLMREPRAERGHTILLVDYFRKPVSRLFWVERRCMVRRSIGGDPDKQAFANLTVGAFSRDKRVFWQRALLLVGHSCDGRDYNSLCET